MCGAKELFGPPPEKTLDRLISPITIWSVNAKNMEMGPDTLFRMRITCGMTQLQFAQLLGVTPITVSRWERGATKISMAYATHIRKAVEEFKEAKQEKALQ